MFQPTGGGSAVEVGPVGLNARTRVNTYGGGAMWVGRLDEGSTWVYVVDDRDGHVWRFRYDDDTPAVRVTGDDSGGPFVWWADGCVAAGQWIVGVRERHIPAAAGHDGVLAEIAAVHIDTGRATVLAAGEHFYAAPRANHAGNRLAWISWNHPDMPWDASTLWSADLVVRGTELDIDDPVVVVRDASTMNPSWDAEDRLWYVSDRRALANESGGWDQWWNLYREDSSEPVVAGPFEIGMPPWVFGRRRYAHLPDGRVVFAAVHDGIDRLGLATADGDSTVESVDSAVVEVDSIDADADTVWIAAAGSDAGWQLLQVPVAELGRGTVADMDRSQAEPFAPFGISLVDALDLEVPGVDGGVKALYYPPSIAEGVGENIDKPPLPPLLVLLHGGPTSMARAGFNPQVQFWTAHGFAVCDVNYRGSSGFGRRYRDALNGRWGDVDVVDCLAVARALADRGLVDADRMVIRGGSAGGFTVLRALTDADVFAAGAVRYPATDLGALATETHRFEERYLDRLVGPWPQARAIYEERSPMGRLATLTAPLLVLQGGQDPVVPETQTAELVRRLRAQGNDVEYRCYPDEGHGFRSADTIVDALDAELAFFRRIMAPPPN